MGNKHIDPPYNEDDAEASGDEEWDNEEYKAWLNKARDEEWWNA